MVVAEYKPSFVALSMDITLPNNLIIISIDHTNIGSEPAPNTIKPRDFLRNRDLGNRVLTE